LYVHDADRTKGAAGKFGFAILDKLAWL
jgi:hypothetical protein